MHIPTVVIRLDKRRIQTTGPQKGKYRIKLFVTFRVAKDGKLKWDQQPYPLDYYATAEEFNVIFGKDKPRLTEFQDIRNKVRAEEARAIGLIEKYKIYDQKRFDVYWMSKSDLTSIAGQYELKIAELLNAKPKPKVSSAEKYKTSLHSLIEFSHHELSFQEITEEFLQDYETWYTAPDKDGHQLSLTSVGINLRCLRHIFARAIKRNVISAEFNPFGPDGYVIPEGGGEVKNFLEVSEKERFISYRDESETINKYHDFAVFSYFANGLNMSDIFRLKFRAIQEDYIILEREKTKGRKKKKIQRMIIPIHDKMREIINRRGQKSLNPDEYVFPVLKLGMDEGQIFRKVRRYVKKVNAAIKHIFEALGLKAKPTTYTLRHTFANVMMENGATTEDLQYSLGHGSIKTTEHYKHGHSLAKKKKLSEGL
jgi:integrase/recombinase XerD